MTVMLAGLGIGLLLLVASWLISAAIWRWYLR